MLDNYDCASSEKIILMNKDEHMPWMKKKHSEYLDKVECLGIGDKNYLPENGYDGPVWEIDDASDAIELFVNDFFKKTDINFCDFCQPCIFIYERTRLDGLQKNTNRKRRTRNRKLCN